MLHACEEESFGWEGAGRGTGGRGGRSDRSETRHRRRDKPSVEVTNRKLSVAVEME